MKKNNLLSKYKTNAKKEVEGIWYQLDNEIEFLISRQGGANSKKVNEAMAKYYLPHVKRINDKKITEEEALRLNVTSFVCSCIKDWRGITEDGEAVAYNEKDLIEMLIELPEVYEGLVNFSLMRDNYKDELGKS